MTANAPPPPARTPIALVTGASGFLGSHLVDAFRTRGYNVRALVRRTSPRRWLVDAADAPLPGVSLVEGSVTEPASLREAVRDADVVVHCAGVLDAPSQEAFDRVNVEGSAHVARAAAEARVRRLVYISSQAVAGATRTGAPRIEDEPPAPISPYGRSKLAGEQACFAQATGVEVVSIRPPSIYGPRDQAFLRMVRLVASHLQPVSGFLGPERRISIVHVDDVCAAVWLGATHARAPGRAYYVTDGVYHPLQDITSAIRAAVDTWTIPLPLIAPVVLTARALSRAWTAVAGTDGLVTAGQAQQLLAGEWIVSCERLQRELGYAPSRALVPGWAETIAWYRRVGWIPGAARVEAR